MHCAVFGLHHVLSVSATLLFADLISLLLGAGAILCLLHGCRIAYTHCCLTLSGHCKELMLQVPCGHYQLVLLHGLLLTVHND